MAASDHGKAQPGRASADGCTAAVACSVDERERLTWPGCSRSIEVIFGPQLTAPLRSASVRYCCHAVPHHGSDLRALARAALAAPGPPRMDRRRAGRTARGRSAHDPPRRRQAALARLPGRVRPGRRRRLPARRRRRAAAAAARRRRGGRGRRRSADRRVGLDRRDRGDLGPRAGQARAGAARPACGAACARSATRPQRSVSTARGSTPTCSPTFAGACRDALRDPFAYIAREDRSAQRQTEPARGRPQRPPLVPGRVRPRSRRLANVPDRPDRRPRHPRRAWHAGAPSRAAIRPPTCCASCAAQRRGATPPRTPLPPGRGFACSAPVQRIRAVVPAAVG